MRTDAATKAGVLNRQLGFLRRLWVVLGVFLEAIATRLRGYLPALVAVGISLLINAALAVMYDVKRGAAVTFIYHVAFLIAAWCGYLPGVISTVILGYGSTYLQKGTLTLDSVSPSGFFVYLALSLVISAQAASRRRVESLLHSVNARLDSRIQEQTSELMEANARLQDRLAELESLYGKLSVGLCFLNGSLQVLRVNEKFASMSGLPIESHLNRELPDVLSGPLAETLERLCRRVLVTGDAALDHEVTAPTALPGGAKFWSVSCSPVPSASGSLGLQLVVLDVTERRRVEQHMNAVNTDLRRANEDLEQFAYSASHDLQEPIRTVAIYAQMLQRKYSGSLGAEGDLFLTYTLSGAIRLQRLVADLRSYTQVSSGMAARDDADANQALTQALDGLAPAISEAQATISSERLPSVRVAHAQLTQLFRNLISNAIEYRRQTPEVRIDARLNDAGEWVFSVKDNGIGIDAPYHEQIFRLFKRLHGGDKYPGTGIGLAICKKIVERNGGRIWVESALDEGSTFYFSLPDSARPDSTRPDSSR